MHVSAGRRQPSLQKKQILDQLHTANQLPAARGGAVAARAPVPASVPTPVQVVKPPPADAALSHNASVLCNRKRTMPNILSRGRKQCPTTSTMKTQGETAGCYLRQAGWPRPLWSTVGGPMTGPTYRCGTRSQSE